MPKGEKRDHEDGYVIGHGIRREHVIGAVMVILGAWQLAALLDWDVAVAVVIVAAGVGVALRGELRIRGR